MTSEGSTVSTTWQHPDSNLAPLQHEFFYSGSDISLKSFWKLRGPLTIFFPVHLRIIIGCITCIYNLLHVFTLDWWHYMSNILSCITLFVIYSFRSASAVLPTPYLEIRVPRVKLLEATSWPWHKRRFVLPCTIWMFGHSTLMSYFVFVIHDTCKEIGKDSLPWMCISYGIDFKIWAYNFPRSKYGDHRIQNIFFVPAVLTNHCTIYVPSAGYAWVIYCWNKQIC